MSGGDRYKDDLSPDLEDKVVDIPGNDGQYYFGSYFNKREFSIEIAYDSVTEKQLRDLKQLFTIDNELGIISPYYDSELKQTIYDDIKEKEESNTLLPFNLIDKQEYKTNITINNSEDILNLFKMTPHYYRCSEEKKEKISKLNEIDLTIDIIINIYKK